MDRRQRQRLAAVLAESERRQADGDDFQVTIVQIMAYPNLDSLICGGDPRARRVLDVFHGVKNHLLTLPEKRALAKLEELERSAAEWEADNGERERE